MNRRRYGEISFEVDEDFLDYTVVNYVEAEDTSPPMNPLLTVNTQTSEPSQITISRRALIDDNFPIDLYAAHQLEILQAGHNRCELVKQTSHPVNKNVQALELILTVSSDESTFQQTYFFVEGKKEIIVICGSALLGKNFESVRVKALSLMKSLIQKPKSSLTKCA